MPTPRLPADPLSSHAIVVRLVAYYGELLERQRLEHDAAVAALQAEVAGLRAQIKRTADEAG